MAIMAVVTAENARVSSFVFIASLLAIRARRGRAAGRLSSRGCLKVFWSRLMLLKKP
jgi:hypothetical protein